MLNKYNIQFKCYNQIQGKASNISTVKLNLLLFVTKTQNAK